MSDKKGIVVEAKDLSLLTDNELAEKLGKRGAFLVNSQNEDVGAKAQALGGLRTNPADLASVLETNALAIVSGGRDAVLAALEAASRRTTVVVAGRDATCFYGAGIDGKAGKVERTVDSADIALTLATLVDLPIDKSCEAGIIYQVLKDPNLKLTELTRLQAALARMESVIERNNREPWDKHDCA